MYTEKCVRMHVCVCDTERMLYDSPDYTQEVCNLEVKIEIVQSDSLICVGINSGNWNIDIPALVKNDLLNF